MDKKGKIILISSLAIAAGAAFYFLYWRTASAVTPSDAQMLQQQKVVASTAPVPATDPAAGTVASADVAAPTDDTDTA